jgi:hypothetical protein
MMIIMFWEMIIIKRKCLLVPKNEFRLLGPEDQASSVY